MTQTDVVASKLFATCASGDVAGLKELIDKEPDAATLLQSTKDQTSPSAKKISERTIYAACSKGHIDVVKCLLRAGVDPNVNSGSGTPIYAAAKVGHLDLVKLLVEHGADYKNVQGGFSPLFVACTQGKLNVIKYLISRGANPHAFDNPPLVFTACAAGYLDVVKYFIEELQYDINRTSGGVHALKTDGKDSLLYAACQAKKDDITRYLFVQGANLTKTITSQFTSCIAKVIQSNFKPVDQGFYHARLKEMGLVETPWPFFASYSSVLTKIELRTNNLTSLPTELFQMPSLTDLDVSHNHLTAICGENVIWECSNLLNLDASHNQLTHIPSGIFSLPELTELSLAYNLLQRLPGDPEYVTEEVIANMNWTCQKLKKLNLSHNHLKALPDNFRDLANLSVLTVSHNNLDSLPLSCCWGSVRLVHLDASNNQLTDLPSGAPSYWMHTLEKLFLAKNSITEISKNITELSHLTTLDLSDNAIETLPPTSYWTGQRLDKLILSGNKLSLLTHKPPPSEDKAQPEGGAKKPNLTSLFTLSKKQKKANVKTSVGVGSSSLATPIDDKPRELPTSQWASCLHSLHLSGNNIKFLPDYLSSFTNLIRIDISGNAEIKSLPPSLGKLQHCTELTMNGVSISNVPQHLLPGVSRGGSTKHTLAYLRTQFRNCEAYNRMKLMVVGLQGRGKTTLLSVLRDPSASLPENISTVGVNVADWVVKAPPEVVRRFKGVVAREVMDVVFSTWDMAGQEVYYATHQCFLSRNTLYLVVWNMEEGEKGIHHLQPWLLNIQSRAPNSPIIIVGTHLDKLPPGRSRELREHYTKLIRSIYEKTGFPSLSHITFVSSSSKEGIRELQDRIHAAAIAARMVDTREFIVGMQVPASYIELQKRIAEEVCKCTKEQKPPVLNQKEFAALAKTIPNSDLLDPEELSLAAQFLHDNGVLLHYNDQLKGLSNLYFIDPIWLANMLAEIITVPQRQTFVHKGILKESDVPFIFRDTKRFPSKFYQQYLQLMERYEIALSLGNGQYLIPSMLPVDRPPMETPHIPSNAPLVAISVASSKEESLYPVATEPVECIRRRYKMAYIPSGFWSRLISRLLINLKRSGMVENSRLESSAVYWKRGIMVTYESGRFLVESVLSASPGFNHGVDITVWTQCEDFSAMGYIVDQLDSLIDEWFPGLNDFLEDNTPIVQREVMWEVPPQYKRTTPTTRGGSPDCRMVLFPMEVCCSLALTSDTVVVKDYSVAVPLVHLVPDILLTDLPEELKIEHAEFTFNPEDPATRLGEGGAGTVYKGKYRGQAVAIKELLSQGGHEEGGEEEEEGISNEPLFMFRDLRQEVTVLAQLSHPNIVALLGVSIRPMCIVLEFAPMGSLFGVLEKKVEQLKEKQVDSASTILRMPGGVLGHVMTTKIAMQVAQALQYIHGVGIIYRDLKAENALVWSLDPTEKVNIKLADYGISRFANPGGVKGIEGTPGYQAPETIQRKGEEQAFDEKVDIFSYAMLIFELLTGQRPFETLGTIPEINRAVCKGERPLLSEGNLEPVFPAMVELMEDCWSHRPSERPAAHEIISRMTLPGFMCRKHTITRCKDHPLQKVDAIYSLPPPSDEREAKSYAVWTWAKQDSERQFSIMDARKGTFNLAEMCVSGGRVRAMSVTHQGDMRAWVSTVHGEIEVYRCRSSGEPRHLWSFKMIHTVLSTLMEAVEGKVRRVFASLANGTLCVFSCKSLCGDLTSMGDAQHTDDCKVIVSDNAYAVEANDWSDPVFLQLDVPRKSVKCMTFVGGDHLWCGCGNGIVVVDIVNMKVVKQIPVFVKNMALVSELVSDGSAVWGVGLHLSCVLQWDVKTYTLVSVFDCSKVDPTGLVVTTDPREFEDIFDPERAKPTSIQADLSEQLTEDRFNVGNEPLNPSQSSQKISQPAIRRNLTTVYHSKQATFQRSLAVSVASKKKIPLHQKSTRTTSLLVGNDTLWVGRGMGDIIVLDISRGPAHGKVLARLATEGCEKYGNKSHHKLVMVAGEYVVSSQWLEPIDMNKDQTSENSAHQEVTIWEAWGHRQLEEFEVLKATMSSSTTS
eukprot:Em0002g1822a